LNFLDLGMVHTCQVLHDTGTTQNIAGSPIPNMVSTEYKCSFENITTSGFSVSNTDAGKVIISSPVVFLPDNAIVQKGDFISTTELNWAGTYEVQKVDAPEDLFSGEIDHIEAFLMEVAKRG